MSIGDAGWIVDRQRRVYNEWVEVVIEGDVLTVLLSPDNPLGLGFFREVKRPDGSLETKFLHSMDYPMTSSNPRKVADRIGWKYAQLLDDARSDLSVEDDGEGHDIPGTPPEVRKWPEDYPMSTWPLTIDP